MVCKITLKSNAIINFAYPCDGISLIDRICYLIYSILNLGRQITLWSKEANEQIYLHNYFVYNKDILSIFRENQNSKIEINEQDIINARASNDDEDEEYDENEKIISITYYKSRDPNGRDRKIYPKSPTLNVSALTNCDPGRIANKQVPQNKPADNSQGDQSTTTFLHNVRQNDPNKYYYFKKLGIMYQRPGITTSLD